MLRKTATTCPKSATGAGRKADWRTNPGFPRLDFQTWETTNVSRSRAPFIAFFSMSGRLVVAVEIPACFTPA
jgi:hypothetical protein